MVKCTDSYWLREEFSIKKESYAAWSNIHFIHCDRDLIKEADYLAKKGGSISQIITEWK